MKIYFRLILLASLCLIFTSSCKKEIDYHPEWDKSAMSGKIDGVLLECTLATAQFYVVGTKTTLQILGNKGTSGFSLMINDFMGTGTYKVADNNMAIYLLGIAGLQDAYQGYEIGTIKITSYTENKIIKGTFEFTGKNYSTLVNKNITEGQFNISLVPQKLPETNSSTNNLTAKIDGTSTGFTGEAITANTPIGNLLTIVSVNGDKRVAISIIGYKGIGSYDIAKDGTGVYMKDQTATGSFYAETGALIITSEAGGKLKGTFNFKGPNQDSNIKNSVNVTDGVFDMPLSRK
ncbi:hypothetical protein EZ449_06375 [Pedobacter frigidisoli]|uniref:DUF5689 domain-containing protein n=1 Tax=Pedobacter frigidisoli TaxID=2530455 RepID=A0A4R0P5M1_9SPHI|nr:DUF6252 family protein [Pedobacter frigidisoli]TCD11116.1 hypothetical protein EZ449_06375 [Pedobacter frigidisoli]